VVAALVVAVTVLQPEEQAEPAGSESVCSEAA
jgi:hypothetical protein